MSIIASDVAKLRSMTGAGMMECQKALEEANGDLEQAAEILRKKGVIKAAKRADKVAAEGLTNVKVSGNTAVVVEVNSETDFVARNEDFRKVVEKITDHLLANKPQTPDQALAQTIDGATLRDYINKMIATIGEKISLRRFEVVEKTDGDAFGAYIHMGGKISALTLIANTNNEALARDIAMHAAAANPRFLNRDEVPPEVFDKEKEIASEQLRAQGKPENIIENIIKGKMEKFYSEACLVEQAYIKDEEKKVAQVVGFTAPGAKVTKYLRYELGEGIEKKGNDFASEVEAQLK